MITRDEFSFRIGAAKIDPGRLNAEIANKVQPQIEHRGPEIRDLFVADSLFAGHVCACDQTLLARVLPMRLPAHPAHDAVRIKRQIAHRENSFLFGLEIFCDWRTVWSGERRVA